MKPLSARSPVFVDSSGHRRRRIRRLGVVFAVPVVGYVVLLVSSVLGGPQVDTPWIPLPEAGRRPPAPRVTPEVQRATETPRPTKSATNGPGSVRPVVAPTTVPVATPSAQPTATPATVTPSTPSTATPTVTPGKPTKTPGHGKPTAPPGRTKSPSRP
ncbi:hypothetical protein ACFTSF_12370 [Kribbella sp. NPDC056951]|uniref:hypothetical protein n=1 Tax=Kribbella sp. NPDC056951 TaxID=3345978 RepID=UPI00363345CC